MYGPSILAKSMSVPRPIGPSKAPWQYHSRSDHHSKVACWVILFDLMLASPPIRELVRSRRLFFGINHEMRDWKQNRKKNLDLVLCTSSEEASSSNAVTFADLASDWGVVLSGPERKKLASLPPLMQAPVGSVHLALEAKACMTAHVKALPRLYDELNSSHMTVHGATEEAIAAGLVMVNIASTFVSPTPGGPKTNVHRQPEDTRRVLDKIAELPRRSRVGETGFDALSVLVVDCQNDGTTPVTIVSHTPAPPAGDLFSYPMVIERIRHTYETRLATK